MTGNSFLGLSKADLDGRKGDLRHFVLVNGRHLSPKVGHMLHVGGGGGNVEAMGEVGRCPPERPGLGPKVARMDSVPIG